MLQVLERMEAIDGLRELVQGYARDVAAGHTSTSLAAAEVARRVLRTELGPPQC